MNRLLVVGLVAGIAGRALGADDPGTITGTVDKPGEVKSVAAILRSDPAVRHPGKIDARSGEFAIAGLPLEKRFDLVIDYGVARLEGVSLKVPKSDFVDGDPPLTRKDEEQLSALMKRLNQFEDKQEILAISGNIQHAAVLTNKVRTKPFVNSAPGEAIWRCELWYFEREEPQDNWVKVQDTLFVVLYRERLPKADYEKKSITFDPRLGGLEPTGEKPEVKLGPITLPDPRPGIFVRNAPVNPPAKPEPD